MTQAPRQYWVIRHPSSGGPKKTVAQFDTDGETEIPDVVAEYDDFKIQEISARSALVNSVDQSGLNEKEKELLRQVYPIN